MMGRIGKGQTEIVTETKDVCRCMYGIDVGGTFTDFVVIDADGTVRTHKEPTTYPDPTRGILTGIRASEQDTGVPEEDVLVDVVHATTLATNALIERRGARTLLITNSGFRDLTDIRRENRYNIFDLAIRFPSAVVASEHRYEVSGRLDSRGREVEPLRDSELGALMDDIACTNAEAVAVCFLNSYMNAIHENFVAGLIRDRFPDMFVSGSADVAREIREYERFSTAIVNSYIGPTVSTYLATLARAIDRHWARSNLRVMTSTGGICSIDTARRWPVRILESGPAAGVLAATHYAKMAGGQNVLAFDMGGTTAKLCIVREGEQQITSSFEAARISRFERGSGIPLLVPSVELVEIGAGGGSIARVDSLGLLSVGPDSAGAEPGPACYGKGGEAPTVTDADLFLGYLDEGGFLQGQMRLSREKAMDAIQTHVAEKLGVSLIKAAVGVHEVVVDNMASAARLHAAEHGLDVRSFTLVAMGGAGPVHACHLAQELGIKEVWCPPMAGVASAVGLALAPIRMDVTRSCALSLADEPWDDLNTTLTDATAQVLAIVRDLAARDEPTVSRYARMRYTGQGHDIEVPLPDGILNAYAESSIHESFRSRYHETYGHELDGLDAQIVAIRVVASGSANAIAASAVEGATRRQCGLAESGSRSTYVRATENFQEVCVYRRVAEGGHECVEGPALVEEEDSTIVIEPRWHAWLDSNAVLRIQRQAA